MLGIALCCAVLGRGVCHAQGFDFGNYRVLSNAPLAGSNFEYVLKVTLTNRAADALGVSAQVFSAATNTTIVSGLASFGDVPSGQSATCTNTFIVRQHSAGLFDPAPLQWFVSVQSMPLSVFIQIPSGTLLTNGTHVWISGRVGPAVSGVTVGRTNVPLAGTNFSALVPLEEGRNIITAVATNSFGGSGAANVTVNRDTTAPFLSIEAPTNGTIVATRQISVTGQINDAVPGTVNPEQATVTVNGVAAPLVNRSYAAMDVLLAPGTNRIVVVGRDRAGNETSKEIQVIFREQASQKRLVALAGDIQTGLVGTNLPAALLVELVDRNGVVQTNQPITFSVTRGDGLLIAPPDSGRSLTMPTDDKGRASVVFRLGTRAGSGNNQVSVTTPGVESPLLFTAHGFGAAPARISALIPESQVGEVGKPLAQPWTALVTDEEGNPVAGAPLVFALVQGSGGFAGQTMISTNTDSDGRASAVLTLGMEAGINNHVVLALVPGVTNSSVTFVASAQTPQAVPNTRVVGLVLDNANRPMSNVLCIIYRTFLAAVTDGNGRFVISNAPVGALRLLVDARERGYPGEWHALEFDLVTVAGRDNSVDRPIYMLPLDSDSAAMAGGPQDVTLRLKGIPGATMTVFANSMRDAAGRPITNRVTWTEVNQERVPMAPPKGAQFSLAWTVQPPGMRFDPPARICIPNAGFNPGQLLEMFGFDHDLGAFVSLGTGTVTADGSQVCSDSGFGVTKSGWGGFLPSRWPCTAVCCRPQPSPCFDYIEHPAVNRCDCPRFEQRAKSLIRNVAAKVDGKKQAAGGTNASFEFTVTSEHPDCVNVAYRWEFDDGETSTAQNPSHTFHGYRTYHPKVTVACQSCPDSKSTDPVTVVVAPIHLVLHKPKRIDPSEPPIPHDIKLTVGAQTFVNLDNDDVDSAFDNEENDVVGGDDELLKVRIQLPGSVDPQGTVQVQVSEGADFIRLWKSDTKGVEFNPNNALNVADFNASGGFREYRLYVEGIEAHTAQRATRLKVQFLDSQHQLVGEDEAAITVLGLAGLSWEAKFNSALNVDWTTDGINYPLDPDPNWPTAQMPDIPQGVRVFPDARMESASAALGPPRDKVKVRARLSVAPVDPVQFHFRSFDVDDPTADNDAVDRDTAGGPIEDNRGTTPGRAGKIVGSDASGVLALTFNTGEREKTFEFQTTMNPGDNFRIVGSCDPGFLLALENGDAEPYNSNNQDRQRIVHPRITPMTAVNMEVQQPANHVTPTLTVWRFLHVETDSMRAPTEEEVTVTTSLTNVLRSADGSAGFLMGLNLPPDPSTNANNIPHGSGRFENGKAIVGTGAFTVTLPILGNGSNFVSYWASNSLYPQAFKAEEEKIFFPATISGVVTGIFHSGPNFAYGLQVTSQSSSMSNWSNFVGGKLTVGGGLPVRITEARLDLSAIASDALSIAVKVKDDDKPSILPVAADLEHLRFVLRETYVEVLQDGGGITAYNDVAAPFVPNVPNDDTIEDSFLRHAVGTPAFWVGYLLQAYQYDLLEDGDPDSETFVLGVAPGDVSNTTVVSGGNGTYLFTETCQDGETDAEAPLTFRRIAGNIAAHEMGHQLGLDHWDSGEEGVPVGPPPPNMMLREEAPLPANQKKLVPAHKHLIRSRVESPHYP